MTPSPSVLTAATTLADWARDRRSAWSDLPLEIPRVFEVAPEPIFEPMVDVDVFEDPVDVDVDVFEDPVVAPAALMEELTEEFTEETTARPSVFAAVLAGLKACTRAVKAYATAVLVALARLEPLGEPAAVWLMRGAALASMTSVVVLVGVYRGELFARWDRVAAVAIAATRRAEPAPPARPPAGTGRLTVASSEGMAQVWIDGSLKGAAPLTVDLPEGAHRVLLKSAGGSVERVVRIRAGESSDVTEAIFPGWVALTTAVDLTMSEAGQPLKRDERGWAILAPGPHDIHLDNRALGVHEVRRVVVTPGDTTRLSFMPHASAISLTTNEVAEVWIDGASFGQAPLVDQPIAVGVHDVRVRSALHERWLRIRATVQPVQINIDLTAQ